MGTYDGVVSLLVVCVELVFVVNLLVFSQKNSINRLAIGILTILFGYQVFEFLICFMGYTSPIVVYFAILFMTFLTPLGLLLVLKLWNLKFKFYPLIFIPALFFAFYFPAVLQDVVVTKCTVMYAVYNYPLGFLYGLFYYLPVVAAIIILIIKLVKVPVSTEKNLSKILLIGYTVTFVPALLFTIFYPNFLEIIESILCKFAFLFAVSLFYFVLRNIKTVEN